MSASPVNDTLRPLTPFNMTLRGLSWPAAILVVVSHVAWGQESFPVESLICAGILGGIAVIAAAYARPGVVPVLPLMLVRFYFAMGYPVFTPAVLVTSMGRVRLSQESLAAASFAGVIFVTCLLVATFLIQPFARRFGGDVSLALDRKTPYSVLDTVSARAVAGVSILVFMANSRYGHGQAIELGSFSLVTNLLSSPEIPLTLLFWDAHETDTFSSRVLCWVAVVSLSLAGLSTGMLGAALNPWVAAMLLMWSIRQRAPYGMILTAVLAVLIINPAKPAYRQLSWYTGTDVSVGQRAENWVTAFERTYSSAEIREDAARGLALRMSSLIQVVHMFEWVPTRVPHEGPGAWLKLPLYFVPSLFWPGRPSVNEEIHKHYWISFRLMTEKTMGSAITLPSIGDGFWRLGWPGVFLEGTLLGLIIGLFHGIGRNNSRAVTFIGVGYLLGGGGPEGQVLSVVLGLPKTIMVWTSILLMVQWLPTIIAGARKTRLTLRTHGMFPPPPMRRPVNPPARAPN